MHRRIPPDRRCVPLAEWPPADQAAWHRAVASGDILEGTGAAAHWSAKTSRTVIAAYGRWLGFLAHRGLLDVGCAPAERLTEERLREYIYTLGRQVQSITLRNRIRDLAEALRVMEPGADLRLARLAARRLHAQAVPSRVKAARIVAPDRLVELGIAIMAEAEAAPVRNAIWRATRYRMGLMIALLATRAWRLANFVSLRLGVQVQILDDGVMFYLGADETKNRRALAVPCPSGLEPRLRQYLEIYRPMLLQDQESDRLWVTHMRAPITDGGFAHELRKVTSKRLGVALNPHSFRHSLATGMVLANPGNVPHAAALLGHSVGTMTEHYNEAPAQAAYSRYHMILDTYLDDDAEGKSKSCVP